MPFGAVNHAGDKIAVLFMKTEEPHATRKRNFMALKFSMREAVKRVMKVRTLADMKALFLAAFGVAETQFSGTEKIEGMPDAEASIGKILWRRNMTEQEARNILFEFFNKHLRENDEIWIGDVYYADDRGYSFKAGTFSIDEGRPEVFPVWGVNAIDKSVCPFLA